MGKFFLWIIIVFLIGYSIYFSINLIKIRLDYSSMENEAERLFSPASNCPYQEVPERLIQKAEEQNIPLKESDVELYVDDWDGYRVLSFEYLDSIPIFNFKTIYLKFSFTDTVFTRPQ